MSQLQLLVQTKVQIRQDIINKLGLVETLGLVRVSIQKSLKDCVEHKRLNVLVLDYCLGLMESRREA
jgi:hypothetical protein